MSVNIHYSKLAQGSLFYGGVAGAVAALGILGSRQVSFLPKLPMKTTLVTVVAASVASAFSTIFIVFRFKNRTGQYKKKIDDIDLLQKAAITVVVGASLATYGKKMLVDKSISTTQLIVTSIIENCTALFLMSYI